VREAEAVPEFSTGDICTSAQKKNKQGGGKMDKGKGGWPSKNPGKPSGKGRDNNAPKEK